MWPGYRFFAWNKIADYAIWNSKRAEDWVSYGKSIRFMCWGKLNTHRQFSQSAIADFRLPLSLKISLWNDSVISVLAALTLVENFWKTVRKSFGYYSHSLFVSTYNRVIRFGHGIFTFTDYPFLAIMTRNTRYNNYYQNLWMFPPKKINMK